MSDDFIKFVILGEGRVGKTSLLLRYFKNRFNENAKSTINSSFYEKTEKYNGKTYDIKFWDTAGQEKYNALNTIYFQNAAGALLVYDVTLPDTFAKVKDWVKTLKEIVWKNISFVIAGNKLDLLDKILLDQNSSQVNEYAEKEKCKVFYTSCKTWYNVQEAIDVLIQSVLKYVHDNNIVTNKRAGKKLEIKKQLQSIQKKMDVVKYISYIDLGQN